MITMSPEVYGGRVVDFAGRKQKRNERCTFSFQHQQPASYSLLPLLLSFSTRPSFFHLLLFISLPSILPSFYPQLPLLVFFSTRRSFLYPFSFLPVLLSSIYSFSCVLIMSLVPSLSLSPVSASSLISPRYLRLPFFPSLLSLLLFISASPFLLLLCSFFRLSLFPFSFSAFYTFSFLYLSFKTTRRGTLHHFPIASFTRYMCSLLFFSPFFYLLSM